MRSIGHPETGLIEQSGSGLLLLGPTGEKLVEHYSFYAVFQTPEEFRLVADGRDLGTLPIDSVLAPGMLLIFSGRRWVVQEIHDREKVIVVKPAKAGLPPVFGGDPGDIHDKVIDRMFAVLEGATQPAYIDAASLKMLAEARAHYDQLGFRASSIQALGERTSIIATRVGTVKTSTLALALRSEGFSVEQHDGFLLMEVGDETPDLRALLADIRSGEPVDLFAGAGNLMSEKFHPYLSSALLVLDAESSRLSVQALPDVVAAIVRKGSLN
ncbi:hypothetical protein [Thioclava marina]|uniref:hypothetical protein n=1 Tax=Thioclava marina TaxID=1915077 RepID=UPI0023545CF8|nr:hypothetical protein [Thioclava marina]